MNGGDHKVLGIIYHIALINIFNNKGFYLIIKI